MNTIYSSAWLEYIANSSRAILYATAIEDTDLLIVPSVTKYEVRKQLLLQRDEQIAAQAIAAMRRGRVIYLDDSLAFEAAEISIKYKLPMADSFIYTTALAHNAIIWTQDSHFEGLPNVNYFKV